MSWSIHCWNHCLKTLKFHSPQWHCQPKNGSIRSKLVFHVKMLIERWKLKSKRYFEVNYSFMEPFSQSFEVLTQCGDIINTKLAWKGLKLISHILTLSWGICLWNYFSDERISEFWNIDPRCVVIIPKLELSGQNLHLRGVFQLLKIAGFDHWFSWAGYLFRRVTFKDICFYRTPLVVLYKRSSISQKIWIFKHWHNSWKKRYAVPVINIFPIAL